jgi:hypothetical protein
MVLRKQTLLNKYVGHPASEEIGAIGREIESHSGYKALIKEKKSKVRKIFRLK